MDDPYGQPLTPEQQKAGLRGFQAYLEEKWKGHACPICKTNNWSTQGLAQLHNFGRGAPGGGGRHWPLGVVICRECGYVVLMSLVDEVDEWIGPGPVEDKDAPPDEAQDVS